MWLVTINPTLRRLNFILRKSHLRLVKIPKIFGKITDFKLIGYIYESPKSIAFIEEGPPLLSCRVFVVIQAN